MTILVKHATRGNATITVRKPFTAGTEDLVQVESSFGIVVVTMIAHSSDN